MNTAAPAQIPSLTGIRGIAALWVAWLHFGSEFKTLIPSFGYLDFIWLRGGLGVPLFYILSGFILAYVYNSNDKPFELTAPNYWKFLKHRIIRIYPVHLFTLLALAVLVIGAGLLNRQVTGVYTFSSFVLNFFLIQSFPVIGISETWNYPSWTVSVEWFAYLVAFPIGCVMTSRLKFASPSAALFGVMLLTVLAIFIRQSEWIWNFRALAYGILLFLAGMLLCKCANSLLLAKRAGEVALPLVVVCVALFLTLPDSVCGIFFILICPFLLLGCLSASSPWNRFLSTSAIVYLGEVSYSLYLSHALVEKVLKVLLPVERFEFSDLSIRLLILVAYLICITGAALAVYHLVEKPSRSFLRKKFG